MEKVSKIDDLRKIINRSKREGRKIGFVPTMGYLHRGHISLVEESKKHADFHVMSIFVNRKQFNDSNDFTSYPRDPENDAKLAGNAGVDVLFFPDDSEVYHNSLTTVHLDRLTDNLCGAYRPGHFDGVFTIVSKLFNMVQPDVSVFGQKDIQQVVAIEKMVEDLNFPVKIIIAPIVREDSGLAMSSRNKRLSSDERERAISIYSGLKEAEKIIRSGIRKSSLIESALNESIMRGRPGKIEYTSVVDYSTLDYVDTIKKKSVIAAAAYFGKTRLIDNMIVNVEGDDIECVY